MSCGAALERRCRQCGEPAPEGARFCMSCGSLLGDPAPAPAPHDAAGADTGAETDALDERRTVTVLFADLSGYTSVAEKLDPESVKRHLERILGRLADVVVEHGGYVDKFIGDNVMAIFGAPVAHGDDPERAVRAGLAMQAVMGEINEPTHPAARRHVRALRRDQHRRGARGAGPGRQLHGDRRQRERGRAAAVCGAPGYRHGRREHAPRDPRRDRLQRAREAADAEGQGGAGAGMGGARAGGAERPPRRRGHPLVGRSSELAQLHDLLARATRRRGPHLATVIGEPGVGKSRLLRQFEQELRSGQPAVLVRHGRCLPYGSGIVYWPLGEVIRAECAIVDGDPPAVAWAKLSERIGGAAARCRRRQPRPAPRRPR